MRKSFDLRQKKVIDVDTAERIGYIRDIDIDFETGRINSVTIPRASVLGLFSKSKNQIVPWDKVVAIGSEYVIVKQEKYKLSKKH